MRDTEKPQELTAFTTHSKPQELAKQKRDSDCVCVQEYKGLRNEDSVQKRWNKMRDTEKP